MENQARTSMKGYYKTTFLIGLGFFTMGLMDPLLGTYIPIFLNRYVDSRGLIGFIMTLENFFAIALIPIVTAYSDRTRTRIGRRMPFIIITLPITAVIFALLPFSALHSFWMLIVVIFIMNFFKQSARGPVVALMPDIVPAEIRSEANGIINTMGGIAAIVGTVVLAQLMDVKIPLPNLGPTDQILAFPVAGMLVVIATFLLFMFIKERPEKYEDRTHKTSIRESLKLILAGKDKSATLILIALLCWFIGYNGVLPFIGMYSIDFLQTSPGLAALAAGMVAIAYAICAIPSGFIAHKVGRKATIRFSLAALVIIMLLVYLHYPVAVMLELPAFIMQITFWILMFLFGVFWVAVVTNSFPMLWQMATFNDIGIYTGLYYFSSQLAAILAPPVAGGIMDLFGDRSMYMFATVFMLAAFVIMGFVKGGEPHDRHA